MKTSLVRNSRLHAVLIGSVIFITSCKKDFSSVQPNQTNSQLSQSDSRTASANSTTLAQPAVAYEGFGAGAVGGSNSSTVYHVTNLNSSGAGSLAAGIGSNKTIVFDVSGTITGRFDLVGISYLTIDGSGQDITIDNNYNGDGISFDGSSTHHCILKNIHVFNAGGDGINVVDGAHDIMITNCTSYGNNDGNIDVAGDNSGITKNVTIQWCIIGGGRANSSSYSGSTLITGQNVTMHHNLIIPATIGGVGERCPLVHCNYSPVGSPNADIRNNVIWKFGRDNGTGSGFGIDVAYGAAGNAVNNYVYTSVTSSAVNGVTTSAYGEPSGSLYAAGNVSGNSGINANGEGNHAEYVIPSQYAVSTQDACTAASMVLSGAGPSPRNSVDQNYVNSVSLTGCSVTPPANQSPVANAGSDQTTTSTSVTVSGSGSDPDGSIVSYAWSKVSGTGGTITSPGSPSTTITDLSVGTYTFKLTVTDDKGATASDDINITVNSSTPSNQPPTADAGADQTSTSSTVAVSGSGSDPDGSIASYTWSKVSGSGGTITSPNSAQTTITGLSVGSYTFRLTVADDKGATASDDINIIINNTPPPPNQLPTADAGPDQTTTSTSVTVSGSGADPDGSIVSYSWSKVAGSGGTITSPGSPATSITGLSVGTYTFKLTVTDDQGATASDNINITVNSTPPPPNQPPTANAGSDQTVNMPALSVTLSGSGTDTDGSIVSYSWTKVSGIGGHIVSANSASTAVTGLVVGTYVFRLTVTDDKGATDTDDVTITVRAGL